MLGWKKVVGKFRDLFISEKNITSPDIDEIELEKFYEVIYYAGKVRFDYIFNNELTKVFYFHKN